MYWQNIYQQGSSIHCQWLRKSLPLIFFQLSLWNLYGCYFIFWLFLDNLNLHTTPNFNNYFVFRDCAIKFNDYFVFPREFDMEPYTVLGLAKIEGELIADENEEVEEIGKTQSTKYRLVGVVVHSGTQWTGQQGTLLLLHTA